MGKVINYITEADKVSLHINIAFYLIPSLFAFP